MDNGLIIIDELLIEQGFIEKIEETQKPKWKVGDYVTSQAVETEYTKISKVTLHKGKYFYNNCSENCFRDPTESELSTYFR